MFFTSSATVDLLLLLILGTIGTHILVMMRQKRWMILDPLNPFWGGVVVTYVLQSITYYDSLVGLYTIDILIKTLFMVWWSVLFIILGYESFLGKAWGKRLPNFPATLKPRSLFLSSIFMLVLGLVGYAALIASSGSISAWIAVGRGGTRWQDVSGYVAALENFFPAGILMLIFWAEFFAPTFAFRVSTWALGGLTWLWFIYLGTRSRTVIFLLELAAAYYLPRQKNPRLVLIAGAFVGLFLLTSFQAFYRGQFYDLSLHLDTLSWQDVKDKILPRSLGGQRDASAVEHGLGDLEMNCAMAVIEQVPQYVPYNYGYTLVELVTHAIPRQLWPQKYYPLYEAETPIMENRDLSRMHLPPPNETLLQGPALTFVGYWYHAGGIVGLAIAGLLTGGFLRMIRVFLERNPFNQGNMIFYSMIFMVGFYESAATPMYWVFSLPLVWIPVAVLIRLSGERQNNEVWMPALQA